MRTAAIILANARTRITPANWYCGGKSSDDSPWISNSDNCICAAVAIERAAFHDSCTEAFGFMTAAIAEMGSPAGQSVMDWNDQPTRTVEEVHAAFDRAIELAKAAGR